MRKWSGTAETDVEATTVAGGEPRGDAPAADSSARGRAFGRAELVEHIDKALSEIEGLRKRAHYHDGEIERLGKETRRMIEEIQEELKAA